MTPSSRSGSRTAGEASPTGAQEIDLRSDICALPTEEMRDAMRRTELGWATYGEDVAVNDLLELGARLLGQEAALWVPTGGMANLVALLTLAPRGTRVILEASSHILSSEEMGIVELGGLEPVPVTTVDGRLSPALVEPPLAKGGVSLLVIENTHTRAGGTVTSPETIASLAAVAHARGAAVHLDGARLAHAAVALRVPMAELARHADLVAISLNKGLCAPMGAILAGSASVIRDARVHLARLGGATVHRAGIAAAAGLIGLESMAERLADDHARASRLAGMLARVPGVMLDPSTVETNIVLADVSRTGLGARAFQERLSSSGVRASLRDNRRLRFVTHRMIGDEDIRVAAAAVATIATEASTLIV